MKLIDTFASISAKEISVYNLQSVRSSSAEIRSNFVAMKEAPVPENICIVSNESHIQINGQLKLNPGEPEVSDIPNHDEEKCINFTKKMFENVDMNSSSLTPKRSSWESTSSLLNSSNEKENLVNSNGLLYDPISDDESIMLHLSDDELEKSPGKDRVEGESTESSEQNGMKDIEENTIENARFYQGDIAESVCRSKNSVSHAADQLIPHMGIDPIQEDNSDADVDDTEPLSSEKKLAVLVNISDKNDISNDSSNTVVNKEEENVIHNIHDTVQVCSFSTIKSLELQPSNMCLDISDRRNTLNCCRNELDIDSKNSTLTELAAKVPVSNSNSCINISALTVDTEVEKTSRSLLNTEESIVKNSSALIEDLGNGRSVNLKVSSNRKNDDLLLVGDHSQKKEIIDLQSGTLVSGEQGANVLLKCDDSTAKKCEILKLENNSDTMENISVRGYASNANELFCSSYITTDSDKDRGSDLQSDVNITGVRNSDILLKQDVVAVKDCKLLKKDYKKKESFSLKIDHFAKKKNKNSALINDICEKNDYLSLQTENHYSSLQSEICMTTFKKTTSVLCKADDVSIKSCVNVILNENLDESLDDESSLNRSLQTGFKLERNDTSFISRIKDSALQLDKDNLNLQSEKDDTSLQSEKDDTSLQSEKDDTSLQSEKDDTSLQSEKDDTSLQSEKDDTSLQSEKDDTSLQSEKDDTSLQSEKDDTSLQSEKDDTSLQSEKDDTSLQSEKDDTSVQSEKDDTSVHSEKDDTSLHSEKDDANLQSDKDDTSLQSEKDDTNLQLEKDDVRLQSENDDTNLQSDKDDARLQSDKDDARLQSDKDDARLQSDKDDARLQSDKDDARLQSDKDATSLQSDKDATSLQSDKDATSLQSDKDDMRLQSDQDDMRLQSDQDDMRLQSDQDDMRLQSDKDDMRLQSDKDDMRLQSDKDDMRLQSDKDDMRLQSEKDDMSLQSEIVEGSSQSEKNDGNLQSEKDDANIQPEKDVARLLLDKDSTRLHSQTHNTELQSERNNCSLQSRNDTPVQEQDSVPKEVDHNIRDCDSLILKEDSVQKENCSLKVVNSGKNKIGLSFLNKCSAKGKTVGLQSESSSSSSSSSSNSSIGDSILLKTGATILNQCNNVMLDEDDSNEMEDFTLKIDGSDDKDVDSSSQTDNSEEEKYDASQSDSNDSLSLGTSDLQKTKTISVKSDYDKQVSIFSKEKNILLVVNEAVSETRSNIKNDLENVDAADTVHDSKLNDAKKIEIKFGTHSTVKLDSNKSSEEISNVLLNDSKHNKLVTPEHVLSDVDSDSSDTNQMEDSLLRSINEPTIDIFKLKSVDNSSSEVDISNSHYSVQSGVVSEHEFKDHCHKKGSGQLATEMGDPEAETKPGNEEEERQRRKRASIQEDQTKLIKRTKVSKSNSVDLSSEVNDDNSESKKDVSQEKKTEEATGTNVASSSSVCVSTSKRPSEAHTGFIEVKKVRIMPEVERHLKEAARKISGNSSVAINNSSSDTGNVAENSNKVVVESEKAVPGKDSLSNLDQAIERVVAAASLTPEATTRSSENAASNNSPKKLNPMPFMRQLHHSQIKKLTRNDLEELVVQKLCEVVTERCQVGELRQRAQSLEQMLEQWRKKAMQLSKQVKDMEMVMKRFVNDQRSKKDRHVIPVKITRSVGLQVHLGQLPPLKLIKGRLSEGNRTAQQQVRRRINRTIAPSATTTSVATPQVSAVATQPPPVTVQKVVPAGLQKTATTTSPPSPVVRQSSTMYANIQPATAKPTQTSIKTIPSRCAVTTTASGTTSTPTSINPNLRLTSPTVTNRTIRPVASYATHVSPAITTKSGQDLKVIDLTDEEDRTKTNFVRNTVTAGSSILPSTTTSIASTNSNLPTNSSVSGRGIRVVQPHQLTGTTAILAPGGTNTPSAGQRLAYFVPSTVGTVSQRQVLIATSTSQVRPGGVMSGGVMTVPNRQNQLSTILFKSGTATATVVPVAQGTGSPTCSTTILRTTQSISGSPLQQVLSNQRPNQAIRVPTTMVPMGRVTTVGSITPVTAPTSAPVPAPSLPSGPMHPAPLPSFPAYGGPLNINWKLAPPKPDLKISKVVNRNQQGIVLSWNMQVGPEHEEVASYQLYAYQEGSAPPSTTLWKKVGDVKALPLPMACTLTQFMEGHKYHFAVRAIDVHTRCGPFSMPGNIVLTRK